MAHTIAIINQKGGVGKTTTAINVGSFLAKMGRQVLIVDLDPQGNATSGLGIDRHVIEPTTYDLLFGRVTLDKSVTDTETNGLRIVPANSNLAASEIELSGLLSREFKLKEALSNAASDYILIDCPPSLGLLTINALSAAESIIIPVQAEYYALEGLSQLLDLIKRVQQSLNPSLELLGLVVTMYNSRTSLADQVSMELKKHFGDKVFSTHIPRNVRLAEAPSFGKTIVEHDKWSKGARAYKQLTKEVEKRVYG